MTEKKHILVVDDEQAMCRLLELMLTSLGHEVVKAGDGRAALTAFDASPFDLVLTDMRMPLLDGLGLLKALRERGSDVPVILLTAHGTIETAVEAMKLGASDYIMRPFEVEAVELAVTRALRVDAIHRENRFLRDEASRSWGDFIGASPPMQQLYDLVGQVAPTRSSVLIVGETGTGKELVARALHRGSGRSGLFVAINCAAIPADLLESEMFGHLKGAFTGASRDRAGKCELASGGTLFLDEITELPPPLQAKMLRVIQEGTLERLGAQGSTRVDLRIVAATNRDPQRAVDEGVLRADLYFRLNVVRIDVPLLRDRLDDLPMLAEHFLAKYASELGRSVPRLGAGVLECLRDYSWPGNVRELENLMERAAVLCRGPEVTTKHLPREIVATSSPPSDTMPTAGVLTLKPQVEALEKRLIEEALRRTGDNKAAAARLLEISERALWYKVKRYFGDR